MQSSMLLTAPTGSSHSPRTPCQSTNKKAATLSCNAIGPRASRLANQCCCKSVKVLERTHLGRP